MSRIASVFQPGHKALIPYLTVGYPDVETTLKAVPLLVENGCDIIELGIPFSDPLADGVTIQRAAYGALQQGVTPEVCLEVARQLHEKVNTPFVFMTYYNSVFNFGLEAFCQACIKSGVSGLIIPDLPPEEGMELENITRRMGLDLIYLLAPTSTDKRIELVASRSQGFIYLVSITGVTGARQSLPAELDNFIKRVRKKTQLPLCVGFGISTPEQVRRVTAIADGVIIGSRLIQLIEEDGSLSLLRDSISSLREAIG